MLALHGTGVSDGVVIGKAFVLQRDLPEIPEYVIPQEYIEEEVTRFQRAVEASRRQLMTIREHIPANAPPEASSFLDAHLLMLDDKMISMAPIDTIRQKQCNAEWSLKAQSDILSAVSEAAQVWPAVELELQRPIPLWGHVTDAGTGAPVAATVSFPAVRTFARLRVHDGAAPCTSVV